MYADIYDDAMWLINLVENLLSVSRIEEGRMNLRLSTELMDEVVSEALRLSLIHILLNRQNIDVMALSYIQLPNGFSDPALRDGYFKNRVVVSQSNVVRDIV